MDDTETTEVRKYDYYEKGFNRETNDWCILKNLYTNTEIVHRGLTEEEADAFLKLLRS